jgi:ribosomal protein S18 acetylase RimI-like enzyme
MTSDSEESSLHHVLDSPMWESLRTRHSEFARIEGNEEEETLVIRYQVDIAPFIAVKPHRKTEEEHEDEKALEALVAPGEVNHFLSFPPKLSNNSSSFTLEGPVMLDQMVYLEHLEEVEGPEVVALVSEEQQKEILELAGLVYPHYFRPQTAKLGRYFGIYENGLLAAMIGERMATEEWQEISAVCTNPNFNGRGFARRLLVWLSNDVLTRGRKPFLHVSPANQRAKSLYLRNGYQVRKAMPFWSLKRNPLSSSSSSSNSDNSSIAS